MIATKMRGCWSSDRKDAMAVRDEIFLLSFFASQAEVVLAALSVSAVSHYAREKHFTRASLVTGVYCVLNRLRQGSWKELSSERLRDMKVVYRYNQT